MPASSQAFLKPFLISTKHPPDRGLICVTQTKTNRNRIIPMNQVVRELLSQQLRKSEYVFTSPRFKSTSVHFKERISPRRIPVLRANCTIEYSESPCSEDADFVRAALRTGALGYVVKSRMANDLCAAINGAISGHLFVSPSCIFSSEPD